MKTFLRGLYISISICAGLFALVAVGYGTVGLAVAVTSKGGGFVGEEDFYRSALLLISLAALVMGALSGAGSYVFWRLWRGRAVQR